MHFWHKNLKQREHFKPSLWLENDLQFLTASKHVGSIVLIEQPTHLLISLTFCFVNDCIVIHT